ncbi:MULTISPECIES: hypothetical protein [Cupriavidus]
MAKRQVVSGNEAWWVWLGEAPAVRVASAEEAMTMLKRDGRDCTVRNLTGRADSVCAVLEILWNEPFRDDEEAAQGYHRVVWSPWVHVLWQGAVRGYVCRQWGEDGWWPAQYDKASADPNTVVLRGKRTLVETLSAAPLGAPALAAG